MFRNDVNPNASLVEAVVHGVGRPVPDVGVLPRGDLGARTDDGSTELTGLGRARPVSEFSAQPGDELEPQPQRRISACRSTSSRGRRSLIHACEPQPAPNAVAATHSTFTRNGPTRPASVATSVTAGSATRSAHMHVGPDSTRALDSVGVKNRQNRRALVLNPGPSHPRRSEEP